MSLTGKRCTGELPKILAAVLILQMAGCVIVPYPVSDEIAQSDGREILETEGVEITDQVYITVGPRKLIDDVSKRIVRLNSEIELVDPLLFRDTAFPSGGWSLKELLQPGNRNRVSEKLDVQYLVLLTPLLREEGEEEGIFIPLAFGAMSYPENSTLSALIIDLRSGSVITQLTSSSSGHGRLLYYVIYIVAADPMTESAVISGLSESIAKTLAAEAHSGNLRVAVLALEHLEEAIKNIEDLKRVRETAALGDQDAQWTLFEMDPTEGNLIWLCRAADQGHINARYELGKLYYYGSEKYRKFENIDINPDLSRSCMWFSMTGHVQITGQPNQGNNDHLSVLFRSVEVQRTASVMTKDELDEAKRLISIWEPGQCGQDISYTENSNMLQLCSAADGGDFTAREELGRVYYSGLNGVEYDLPRAYMWYQLAANVYKPPGQGDGNIPSHCNEMTSEQLSTTVMLLEEWKPGQCEQDMIHHMF